MSEKVKAIFQEAEGKHYDADKKRFLNPGEHVELTPEQLAQFGGRFKTVDQVKADRDAAELQVRQAEAAEAVAAEAAEAKAEEERKAAEAKAEEERKAAEAKAEEERKAAEAKAEADKSKGGRRRS